MESAGDAARREAGLPVDTLDDALPHLRRPFTPEAVRFKVQTAFSELSGCLVVAYIDARLVIERLNVVTGGGWSARYEPGAAPGMTWCHLTVFYVTRSDVGEGQGRSEGQKAKARVSDSLKRAGVHFGVGVSVYALPQIKLFRKDSDRQAEPWLEVVGKGDRRTLGLTPAGHRKLRVGYADWLDAHGRERFGDPLDHGDVEGETVDPDPAEDYAPAPAPAVADERAEKLEEEIRAVYESIDGRRLPVARFNAQLAGSRHSHAELERYLEHLKGLAA